MSANCCNKTFDLGCIGAGDGFITLPIDAAVTGTYTAYFKYLGREISFPFEAVEGEAMTVGVSGLNENHNFYFYILDPEGERVLFGEYDCFSVRVRPCTIGGEVPDDPSGPCDPIDIQLNGVSVAAPECGDTIDIPVLNTLGTPVGSWNGTRWLAPSGQAQLRDTDNNPISTAAVPSNTAVALTAPDATAVVRNSVPTVISTTAILSGQSVNIALDDITHTDSDGSPAIRPAQVPFVATPCGGACPYDGIIQINGVPVDTFGPFDPCEDNTLTININ